MNRPFAWTFLIATGTVTTLLWSSPFLLPAGTAQHLDGASALVEHRAQWSGYAWPAAVAYGLGDLLCHQRAERSWTLGGNQAPMDVRMLALFSGATAGFALALRAPARPRLGHAWSAWTGRRWPRGGAALAWGMALAPTAADGFLQLWTPYESTSAVRLVTGVWTGAFGALLIGVGFDCLWRPLPATRVDVVGKGPASATQRDDATASRYR